MDIEQSQQVVLDDEVDDTNPEDITVTDAIIVENKKALEEVNEKVATSEEANANQTEPPNSQPEQQPPVKKTRKNASAGGSKKVTTRHQAFTNDEEAATASTDKEEEDDGPPETTSGIKLFFIVLTLYLLPLISEKFFDSPFPITWLAFLFTFYMLFFTYML